MVTKGKGKKSVPHREMKDQNNISYKENIDIANAFNNYFTNLGPTLVKNIPHIKKTFQELLPPLANPHSFFLNPTTPNEITNIMKLMKPKTSHGYDDITPKLVRLCIPAISAPIAHIANLSMSSGVFPDNMKLAKVICIYKNDDPTRIINYRPISLLPTFSKVLERLVYNRLYTFLTKYNILNDSQYGFRKGLSTELAVLELQDRIAQSIAKKEWCIGVFLDISKAFDTLDHKILLAKLNHIGLRGNTLDWFDSYLSGRKQYIHYENAKSSLKTITSGVPQGSILGPLLFLIYINDLTCIISKGNPILFADDTNILYNHPNLNYLTNIVNDELTLIVQWFTANKLSLNTNKTNIMIFRTPQRKLQSDNVFITINNFLIKKTNVTKFLGIYIDEHLNWKTHLTKKANQVLKVVAILSKLQHLLSSNILRTIYNALIYPHLSYCITSWGNVQNREVNRLFKLQKRALRYISKAKYNSHTDPLFKKQNLLKLEDIFQLNCSKLYFKNIHSELPKYHQRQLLSNSHYHRYQTRNMENIHMIPMKSNIEIQRLNVKIAKIWNNLPETIKTSTKSTESTTCNLKKHFIALYKDHCQITDCYICNNV